MSKNFMTELNEQQVEAVLTCDRPLRVVAGAGSGKTKVITSKICYLIEGKGFQPERILAVTFTNKAANEMKNRVREMINNRREPLICTFHSLCARILREEAKKCGLDNNFTILDESDKRQVIRLILKDMNIETSKANINSSVYKISGWKNEGYTVDDLNETDFFDYQEINSVKIFKRYEKTLQKNNQVDFDDLLLKIYTLFKNNKEAKLKWASRFDYILIDEFQDTNDVQFSIVKAINNERNTITVVGDPDQTIYTWRGAKMDIIMNFEKNFDNAVNINLEKNYRSTQNILSLANKLIDNNKYRIKKNLFTEKQNNKKVKLFSARTAPFEAKFIANQIKKLVEEENHEYKDFFVLYRINSLSANVEQALTNANIPYKIIGGTEFRDRKVIKDLVSMIQILIQDDKIATKRVLNLIPRVGAATIENIEKQANLYDEGILNFILNYNSEAIKISKHIDKFSHTMSEAKKLKEQNESVLTITNFLINELEYKSLLKTTDENYEENLEHINTFLDIAKQFDEGFDKNTEQNRLEAFCESVYLGVDDRLINRQEENKVSLMTIHASKGLENKVVFIMGINEGIFPSGRSSYSNDALEEERRTLYVAITRAKEILYLSYVDGDYSFVINRNLSPSRFINELDPSLLDMESNIFYHSAREMSSDKNYNSIFNDSKDEKIDLRVKPGDIIIHKLFGEGVVSKFLGKMMQVAFNNPAYKIQIIPIESSSWEKK